MISLKNILIPLGIVVAIAISVFLFFPTGPRPTKVQFSSGKVSLPDWMVELKEKKDNITYFALHDRFDDAGVTRDKEKIEQIFEILMNSYQLKKPVYGPSRVYLKFGLNNRDYSISISCNIDDRRKMIYGRTWASYDLYQLLWRGDKFDWDFFEVTAEKQSSKTEE